ncbi:MAG: hypothetical protein ACE5FW_01655 [Candidatus Aenigmatarchaeota archaeon]
MRTKAGLLVLMVVGVIWVSGCVQQPLGPMVGVAPCNWVYKTNGDYFDLIRANLGHDEFGNEIIARIPGGMNKTELANDYIHEIDGCSRELGWVKPTNVAFLSKTVQEWIQEDIDCMEEIRAKDEQLKIEKCGSLDFDFFVECNTFQSATGEEICAIGPVPGPEIENPTNCTYYVSLEENVERNSCKGHTYSIDMVIDRDPFTELYFCNMSFSIDEINNIILNNQLDTQCEKLV